MGRIARIGKLDWAKIGCSEPNNRQLGLSKTGSGHNDQGPSVSVGTELVYVGMDLVK